MLGERSRRLDGVFYDDLRHLRARDFVVDQCGHSPLRADLRHEIMTVDAFAGNRHENDPGTIWRESVKALMATGSSVGTVVGINRPSTACAISVRLIGIMVGLLTVVTPLMVGFVFDVENVSFHV